MTEETAPIEEKKEPPQRQCEGCTKCCEGWLSANLHGRTMHRGKKCHFVSEGKGCAIYENRPEDPCKVFLCAWRYDYNIPEWFKPNKSNVICMWKRIGEGEDFIPYLHVVECDSVLDVKILSWLIHNQINYCYTLHGQPMYNGTPEFIKAINESFK